MTESCQRLRTSAPGKDLSQKVTRWSHIPDPEAVLSSNDATTFLLCRQQGWPVLEPTHRGAEHGRGTLRRCQGTPLSPFWLLFHSNVASFHFIAIKITRVQLSRKIEAAPDVTPQVCPLCPEEHRGRQWTEGKRQRLETMAPTDPRLAAPPGAGTDNCWVLESGLYFLWACTCLQRRAYMMAWSSGRRIQGAPPQTRDGHDRTPQPGPKALPEPQASGLSRNSPSPACLVPASIQLDWRAGGVSAQVSLT